MKDAPTAAWTLPVAAFSFLATTSRNLLQRGGGGGTYPQKCVYCEKCSVMKEALALKFNYFVLC